MGKNKKLWNKLKKLVRELEDEQKFNNSKLNHKEHSRWYMYQEDVAIKALTGLRTLHSGLITLYDKYKNKGYDKKENVKAARKQMTKLDKYWTKLEKYINGVWGKKEFYAKEKDRFNLKHIEKIDNAIVIDELVDIPNLFKESGLDQYRLRF